MEINDQPTHCISLLKRIQSLILNGMSRFSLTEGLEKDKGGDGHLSLATASPYSSYITVLRFVGARTLYMGLPEPSRILELDRGSVGIDHSNVEGEEELDGALAVRGVRRTKGSDLANGSSALIAKEGESGVPFRT